MKNPIVLASLIFSVALIICTYLVMSPVYTCMSEAGAVRSYAICLHGVP